MLLSPWQEGASTKVEAAASALSRLSVCVRGWWVIATGLPAELGRMKWFGLAWAWLGGGRVNWGSTAAAAAARRWSGRREWRNARPGMREGERARKNDEASRVVSTCNAPWNLYNWLM